MGVIIRPGQFNDTTGNGGGLKGGEPPYDGNMEARIGRLEQFAGQTGERLARMETTLDHVAHETSQFKWWLAASAVAIVVAMIATVVGTGIGIQQMTVTTFQAAKEQAPTASQQPIIINVPAAPPASPTVQPKK